MFSWETLQGKPMTLPPQNIESTISCVYIYIHKHIQYTHTMYTRDRYMYVYVYYIQIFIYGGSQVYFFPQPLLEIMKNSTKGRIRIFFGKQHAIGPARPPAQSRKISLELEAVFCRSTGCKTWIFCLMFCNWLYWIVLTTPVADHWRPFLIQGTAPTATCHLRCQWPYWRFSPCGRTVRVKPHGRSRKCF